MKAKITLHLHVDGDYVPERDREDLLRQIEEHLCLQRGYDLDPSDWMRRPMIWADGIDIELED